MDYIKIIEKNLNMKAKKDTFLCKKVTLKVHFQIQKLKNQLNFKSKTGARIGVKNLLIGTKVIIYNQ